MHNPQPYTHDSTVPPHDGAAEAAARAALIARERADTICRNGPATLLANLLCGIAVTAVASGTPAPNWFVFGWMGSLAVVLLARYLLLRSYASLALRKAPTRWLRRHVAGTALAGTVWAVAAAFLPYAEPTGADLTILFVMVGMVAGGITSSVVDRKSVV